VTDTCATALYKIDQSEAACRLVYATSEDLSAPSYSVDVSSNLESADIVKLPIAGLTADTRYYYGLELDGVLLSEGRGTFNTFPAGARTFSFAFGNSPRDATGRTAQSGLAAALDNDLLFFLNTGDCFYLVRRATVWTVRSVCVRSQQVLDAILVPLPWVAGVSIPAFVGNGPSAACGIHIPHGGKAVGTVPRLAWFTATGTDVLLCKKTG
jgi:hypothetical protein